MRGSYLCGLLYKSSKCALHGRNGVRYIDTKSKIWSEILTAISKNYYIHSIDITFKVNLDLIVKSK